jgi:hypothetical protein
MLCSNSTDSSRIFVSSRDSLITKSLLSYCQELRNSLLTTDLQSAEKQIRFTRDFFLKDVQVARLKAVGPRFK